MTTETNEELDVPMLACLGGPLHGQNVPADEPDAETTESLDPEL